MYETHPKHLILAALFVACKVEENRIDAASIASLANVPDWDAEILRLEIPLLQALDFRLRVESPHHAVLGWLDELKR